MVGICLSQVFDKKQIGQVANVAINVVLLVADDARADYARHIGRIRRAEGFPWCARAG